MRLSLKLNGRNTGLFSSYLGPEGSAISAASVGHHHWLARVHRVSGHCRVGCGAGHVHLIGRRLPLNARAFSKDSIIQHIGKKKPEFWYNW